LSFTIASQCSKAVSVIALTAASSAQTLFTRVLLQSNTVIQEKSWCALLTSLLVIVELIYTTF
jgi:carboxylesterase type B